MTGANRHVIDQSLQILREGLMPFLRERIDAAVRDRVLDLALARELVDRPSGEWNVSVMLRVMRARWNEVCPELDRRARPLLFEAASYHAPAPEYGGVPAGIADSPRAGRKRRLGIP
ncbi:MAG: hypothetical protein H5U21_00170 [Porphyrobacter sp.]|nr:hypothetical protein [Porphyrobacter sp.]